MALVLTKVGRTELARSFYRDLVNSNDYYYIALGKTTEWDDEELPDTPVDNEFTLNAFRKNILFVQKVNTNDICFLVRRIDWESGTIYDQYDDRISVDNPAYSGATELYDANFYVITNDYRVYKCIDNNDNSESTIEPTSTDTSIEEYADGYKWKFMFQVSSSDQTKFLDAEHIPVRKLTTTPYGDVNGEIDSITVVDAGSGYTSTPSVVINGDGTGATAHAVLDGTTVDTIEIDSAGSGYSFALVSITGGGGSGALATASVGDTDSLPALQSAVESTAVGGAIDKIILNNGGESYTAGDVSIGIEGDGTGAEATATISATGIITGITVTSAGTGYTYANILINQTAGVGVGAEATAVVAPINGHGFNPIKELFGTTLGITISLADNTNSDLILNNDFRQIGLMKNIYNYDADSVYTSITGTASFVIDVNDNSYYHVDDIVSSSSGGTFRVAQLADDGSGTFQIHLQPIIGLITSSDSLENITTGVTGLAINTVTEPEINITTGDIVYIENRGSVTRDSERVETIKALIKF